jgi:hypothetical protein
LIRAAFARDATSLRTSFSDFLTGHISIAINIAFLAHQALVATDAVVRTIVRSFITHTRLLEWETATEAELGIRKRTPVDMYLDWVPLASLVIALEFFFVPAAAPYALPFLVVWSLSKVISIWLNRSPLDEAELSDRDHSFLREVALRTWRYFAEYSCEKNRWFIPDNVQEQPYRVAERLSPTNLGLLLNARQAAFEMGYLTLAEAARLNELTLESFTKLPRHLGHLLNWYDNVSLAPLEPKFISSVDSGNLIASLWSCKQGFRELSWRPVISDNALAGIADHYHALEKANASPALVKILKLRSPAVWLPELLKLPHQELLSAKTADPKQHVVWPLELRARIEALREQARLYMPWYLPEYDSLRALLPEIETAKVPLTPQTAAEFFLDLDRRLQGLITGGKHTAQALEPVERLRREIPTCRENLQALAVRLEKIASECDRLANEMSFSPLVNRGRNLLSVGYDVAAGTLNKSCYDLLASEARTATFIAVAQGDLIQDGWFRMGRQHTNCEGETTLVSWTGTMFEYLMPVIWLKSHPNTLLDRAVRGAVKVQQAYGRKRRVPWGISEAAYRTRDLEGNYQYAAFGIPCLALSASRSASLVISAYSSCLALMIEPMAALKNLLVMKRNRWFTEYGFYESVDYSETARGPLSRKGEIIRCWMAHHQGMSLAAICNVLHDWPFQRWFHAERLVQASELILQERPLRARPPREPQERRGGTLPPRKKSHSAKAEAVP